MRVWSKNAAIWAAISVDPVLVRWPRTSKNQEQLSTGRSRRHPRVGRQPRLHSALGQCDDRQRWRVAPRASQSSDSGADYRRGSGTVKDFVVLGHMPRNRSAGA